MPCMCVLIGASHKHKLVDTVWVCCSIIKMRAKQGTSEFALSYQDVFATHKKGRKPNHNLMEKSSN